MQNNLVILSEDNLRELLETSTRKVLQEMGILASAVDKLPTSGKPPVTGKELCTYLGISAPTLIRWRKKKKIPYLRVGTAIRYDIAAVLKAIGK